jgi:predicted dehydrogenase
VTLGATTLTIPHGHCIDAMRFVVGDFSRLSALVTTQVPEWLEVDTQRLLGVTAPDNVLVSGQLASGAVASVHVASIPWAGSNYRMEIYGREGTLVATSDESPQLGDVHLQGATANGSLEELDVPSQYVYVPEKMPQGSPYNVGQLYALFAKAIRTGDVAPSYATFDTAVSLHRLIDTIRQASEQGRQLEV